MHTAYFSRCERILCVLQIIGLSTACHRINAAGFMTSVQYRILPLISLQPGHIKAAEQRTIIGLQQYSDWYTGRLSNATFFIFDHF